MSENSNFTSFLRENKTLIILIAVGLFLVELEIFAVAAVKSGRKSWLQVSDARGTVIYETDGSRLSDFNKYYFEKTFGPLDNYHLELVTREISFPFRAWFVAAFGVPIGAVLLFGFVFKAYVALARGDRTLRASSEPGQGNAATRIELIFDRLGRLNIFAIGFLAFAAVMSYWIVPNALTYIGKTGMDILVRYKWVFLAAAGALLLVAVWIIYLRYLLARKAIETQAEIDKYRLRLEYRPADVPEKLALMDSHPPDAEPTSDTDAVNPESQLADRIS